jgi:glycine/D-amino acid oxidase-like deaminating enzyme
MCAGQRLMTKYGVSPWIDQFPKSRVPAYPRQRGAMQIDVAIVGGGLTGCLTAYAFAAAGTKVVLVEADRIGRGASGSSAGWIADEPGVPFADLVNAAGRRPAQAAWQAWRRAALDFAALLRRLDIKCGLEPRATLTVAATPEQVARVKREQKARRDAGIDAPLLTARAIRNDFALDAEAGLRSKDGATVDPYRACVGLAASAAARGALLFELSPVRRITFNRRTADVATTGGTMRVNRVVIATGQPTPLFKALARHFWFKTTYLVQTRPVPAKTRHLLGRRDAIVRDSAEPPHLIRWIGGDRMLISGADSDAVLPKAREKVVVQRTGQLMYELSTLYPDISGIQPEYGWSAEYARTGDGLPYIGAHRNYPHHLFAWGDASHSLTGAYLASRVMLRQHLEETDPVDDAFGFNR